jgi:hypothetical protein
MIVLFVFIVMVTAADGGALTPGHQLAQLHAVHLGGRPVENNGNISDEFLNADKKGLPYLLPVSAEFGTDGAALVKKGVSSSMNETKSPVSSVEISSEVKAGEVTRVSSVEIAS